MQRRVPLVLATACFSCGPIQYIANVPLEAAGALGEAKHMHAEKFAPYEMTAADEYLHQARQLAGVARYQSSVRFARKATEMARAARKIAERKAVAQEKPPVAPPPALEDDAAEEKPANLAPATPAAPTTRPPVTKP